MSATEQWALNKIKELERHRDELLAACLKYQKCCETTVTIDGYEMSAPMEDWYEFDEAIAKAQGVQS